MSTIFITASGTGVGKTLLTRLAIAQLRSSGATINALKPVVTGFDPTDAETSDPGLLLAALGRAVDTAELDRISPWRFRAALSPDMAAARERRSIPFDQLIDFCRPRTDDTLTLVEGVGGVLVPLDDDHTVTDWIVALGAPAVLVTGSYLGAISHTLAALQSLQARGIEVRSIVVSASAEEPVPTQETARTLARHGRTVPVFVLPRMTATMRAPEVSPMLGLGD
ncbi:MAG TPA: dethiobiotin synthase [Gammaproteobacteria bacterium]|nr:dethiobiotin synthase [Gammaproteobacteria bacterium]